MGVELKSAGEIDRMRASGRITARIGRPCARANPKSRSSCAGTAMIAPVPYSIRT